jgi:hypothetical protein
MSSEMDKGRGREVEGLPNVSGVEFQAWYQAGKLAWRVFSYDHGGGLLGYAIGTWMILYDAPERGGVIPLDDHGIDSSSRYGQDDQFAQVHIAVFGPFTAGVAEALIDSEIAPWDLRSGDGDGASDNFTQEVGRPPANWSITLPGVPAGWLLDRAMRIGVLEVAKCSELLGLVGEEDYETPRGPLAQPPTADAVRPIIADAFFQQGEW